MQSHRWDSFSPAGGTQGRTSLMVRLVLSGVVFVVYVVAFNDVFIVFGVAIIASLTMRLVRFSRFCRLDIALRFAFDSEGGIEIELDHRTLRAVGKHDHRPRREAERHDGVDVAE